MSDDTTRRPENESDQQIARGLSDSIKGKATHVKGKIEDAAGALTGNLGTQAKGKLDEFKGTVQDLIGEAERSLED